MRVLIVVVPATAHLYPVVPLAWALRTAGHEVRVASHPEMVDDISAAGLTAVPVGEQADLGQAMRDAVTNEQLENLTEALAIDPEQENLRSAIRYYTLAAFAMYYPDGTAPAGRQMVDDLVDVALGWQPDLVLWDPLSFPAPIAARACGAAHARMLWGRDYIGWLRQRLDTRLRGPDAPLHTDPMAERMAPTLQRFGEEFTSELVVGQWSMDLMPPGMRFPLSLRYVPLRRVPYTAPMAVPEWLRAPAERPRVCLTLGLSTRKFLPESLASLAATLLAAAEGLDLEVVATLTAAQLEAVGEVPENVRVADYAPLDVLLPTCSAVIHHGGGGTFAAAVAHRVPQLVPGPGEGGERKAIAWYVEEQGAGLTLPHSELSVDSFRSQLVRVLEEPCFADGAAALHREMVAAPSPNEAVQILERLTTEYGETT